jgi:hypothetical protein
MYCASCGSEVQIQSKFCSNCGGQLPDSAVRGVEQNGPTEQLPDDSAHLQPTAGLSTKLSSDGFRVSLDTQKKIIPVVAFAILVLSATIWTTTRSDDSASSPSPTLYSIPASPVTQPTDGQIILDWLNANSSTIQPWGSAVELFEGAVQNQSSSNEAIGQATINLYNALIKVPVMPTNIPLSQEFNIAINEMTVVMDRVSNFAVTQEYGKMYDAALKWQAASNLYAAWFAKLPRN